MRVALLSSMTILDGTGQENRMPVSKGSLGMRSVLQFQADMALRMGAGRIIVWTDGLTDALLPVQHRVEQEGARFYAVDSVRTLSGLISASDEVLVVQDGLVPDPLLTEQILGPHSGVLGLPVDPAIAQGFERIDANRAWSGVMMLRGAAVERLAELPDDVEPASALLRIGLQSGTRIVDLPPDSTRQNGWILVRDARDLQFAHDWHLKRELNAAPWSRPGTALADRMAAKMAGPAFAKGYSDRSALVLAAVVIFLAIAMGWFVSVGAGFLGLMVAAILLALAAAFRRLRGEKPAQARLREQGVLLALDFAIILLTTFPWPDPDWANDIFAPVMLIGLIRLASILPGQKLMSPVSDRGALCAILALAGFVNLLHPAIMLGATGIMIVIFFGLNRAKITQV
ncbi:MAG: hypothetical protein ACK5NN_11440 [Sphingomonadaceae bacterium]